MQEAASFGPQFESVGLARRFVREVLDRWELSEHAPASSVLVTEMCSNSVLHARGDFTVTISWEADVLRLAVRDSSRRLPAVKAHTRQAMTGRGLTLIEAYADTWGAEQHVDGKTVWAVLAIEARSGSGRVLRPRATGRQSSRARGPAGRPTAPREGAERGMERLWRRTRAEPAA